MNRHLNNEIKNAAGIYKIVNVLNGKTYVGQTKNFRKRANSHECLLKRNQHDNKHLQFSWNLHGPEAFEFSVIAVIDNPEERTMAEQMWIDVLYDDNCYNMHKKALLRSEDIGEKIGNGLRGRKMSDETRERMSKAHMGKKRGPMTEEAKQKLSAAKRGKSLKKRGPLSEEQKQKLRESMAGRTPWNKGIPMTEKMKEILVAASRGRTPWNKGKRKQKNKTAD